MSSQSMAIPVEGDMSLLSHLMAFPFSDFGKSVEVMSERIKEVTKLADATYPHSLSIKSTYKNKVNGPYG